MKGLLHSKKFKKNLCKWLFMYVGCMLLLTTVVTYSKYISSFESSASARVAKFQVKIENNDCNDSITNECNYDIYRPTDEIDYYFTVDTTNIEVKTKFYLTIYVNEKFDIEGLYEITDKEEKTINYTKATNPEIIKNTNYYVSTTNDEALNIISASGGSVRKFKVVLKYKGDIYNGLYTDDIVKAGYSAEQIMN